MSRNINERSHRSSFIYLYIFLFFDSITSNRYSNEIPYPSISTSTATMGTAAIFMVNNVVPQCDSLI